MIMFSLLNKVPKSSIVSSCKRGLKDAVEGKAEKCLNQVTILGRAGTEPQIKGSEEHPVVTFSVATNTRLKVANGQLKQVTDWHRISCFTPYLRESVPKYLQTGTRVLVTGRLSYGQIVDGVGSVHQTTSIIADNIIYLSNSRQADGEVNEEEVVDGIAHN